MSGCAEDFGTLVFSDHVMSQRLPADVYRRMKRTIRVGRRLDADVAGVVAEAMKTWAIENGATHYTHWFQPMTGITAEKHEAFARPTEDGRAILEFSGKELIQGEPDASSFPSGGLRATFEARGYTAWDPTSYAFIKDGVLCIPTAFCSYGGEALDKKTPLLRSMEALNAQTLRIVRLFGHEGVRAIRTNCGPEQEYFLIDAKILDRRRDLLYTGRTLYGAQPPKGQELEDHYYGVIKPRVAAFMKELNAELWRLGVSAKTEHNEAAPAQHELAPIFGAVNIAADHNQLTMEIMKKVAQKHGMVCLLHEKPFAGVNGSGKHNNWSLSTDTGVNLMEPGDTPAQNAQFLLFLCAVLQAVDDYQEMLRISVASAGNDCRLGGSEAPPAIMSVFLGDELTDILTAIENDAPVGAKEKSLLRIGVHALPRFARDTTDRNRTSPFAFTGNKFEFRSPGAPMSVSECNIVLNAAVAESLRQYADRLEKAEDFEKELHELIRETIRAHKRIIFNGNGYAPEWPGEAMRRGLSNLPTTADCLAHYVTEKNVALFSRHHVFSEAEMRARCAIMAENYCKVTRIEAVTMLEMADRDILPAVSAYCTALARRLETRCGRYEKETLEALSTLMEQAYDARCALREVLQEVGSRDDVPAACLYRDRVLPTMRALRASADAMEERMPSGLWPFPTYGDMLFSVR
ncbi:MAG: glutamine synthetase III [Clostridia bacterium]|nr:glutamine synthetase III [Clostridia bacterium]